RQSEADHAAGLNPPRIPAAGSIEKLQRAILDNLTWQMDHDRKTTGLKALQGKIWADAYHRGAIKGHVYDDVVPALQRWTDAGRSIYIYSSGSVHAQKLLFGHSVAGDLLPFFKGHYDTRIGSKKDAPSYAGIAADIGCMPGEIRFLTDSLAEAQAASAAGVSVILSIRPGTAPLPEGHGFETITSFDQAP
ncbi:MAG: acireductone synthase, partial [Myxococcota bacterium]